MDENLKTWIPDILSDQLFRFPEFQFFAAMRTLKSCPEPTHPTPQNLAPRRGINAPPCRPLWPSLGCFQHREAPALVGHRLADAATGKWAVFDYCRLLSKVLSDGGRVQHLYPRTIIYDLGRQLVRDISITDRNVASLLKLIYQ